MKLRKNKVYTFIRNGWDRFDPNPYHPENGTKVKLTQPHGCPKNGMMGHYYIMDAVTEQFYGLCSAASLFE